MKITLLATVGLLLVTSSARSDIPLAVPVSMPDCQALIKIEPLGVPSCNPLLSYLFSPTIQTMTSAPRKPQVEFFPPVYIAMGKAPKVAATPPSYAAMAASVLAQSVAPEYAVAAVGNKAEASAPVYASASAGSKAVADAPVYAKADAGNKTIVSAPVYARADAGTKTIASAPVYAKANVAVAYQFGQTYASVGNHSYIVGSTQLHPLMSADGLDYVSDVVRPTGLAKEFYLNAKKAKAAGDTAGVLRWTSLYMREMDSQTIRNTMRRE